MNNTCGNCVHFKVTLAEGAPAECRRFPPNVTTLVVGPAALHRDVAYPPLVAAHPSCGEFKLKTLSHTKGFEVLGNP